MSSTSPDIPAPPEEPSTGEAWLYDFRVSDGRLCSAAVIPLLETHEIKDSRLGENMMEPQDLTRTMQQRQDYSVCCTSTSHRSVGHQSKWVMPKGEKITRNRAHSCGADPQVHTILLFRSMLRIQFCAPTEYILENALFFRDHHHRVTLVHRSDVLAKSHGRRFSNQNPPSFVTHELVHACSLPTAL